MKKYLISFFIPWLLFFFMGCSVEQLTFQQAAELQGKYDISIYTREKTYFLPEQPDTLRTNEKDAKEIYCLGWKFNLNDADLVYKYLIPPDKNGVGYKRIDTL